MKKYKRGTTYIEDMYKTKVDKIKENINRKRIVEEYK
jgi:hypothetical protein